MLGQAWDDVCSMRTGGQRRNVESARVCRVHSVAVGEMGDNGRSSRKDVGCWRGGGEKMTCAPRVKDGPPLYHGGICVDCF